MTKKDFIVIADIIKSMPKEIRVPLMLVAIEKLKQNYRNFDSNRFKSYIEGR